MSRSISFIGALALLVALLLVSPYRGVRQGNPASAVAPAPATAASSDLQQDAIDTLAAWPGAAAR